MTKKLLSAALAAIMVFSFAACSKTNKTNSVSSESQASENTAVSLWDSAVYTEDTEIGEGEKTVALTVSAEGKSVVITIKTDAENLGEALRETGVAEGEESEYGLYVKTVNGMYADYDLNGAYWSLYRGEEYSSVGVDGARLSGDGVNEYSLVLEVFEG